MTRNLLLINAHILSPWANPDRLEDLCSLYISDGKFEYILPHEEVPAGRLKDYETIDCQGFRLLNGFVDAHCHVMAFAASLLAVDCRAQAVSSIADIKQSIFARASTTPEGDWVRAMGYHEFDLMEKRHPTRWDLDEISPRHPVRLAHRSGHAVVLNSAALKAVGITNATDEPPGGTIDRDPLSGEPNGLLLEMNDYIDGRIPPLDRQVLQSAMRMASDRFLSYGVTDVCDASPGNTPETYATYKSMQEGGYFLPSVTMMAGAQHMDQFVHDSLRMGVGTKRRSISHIKIMLTLSSGKLTPSLPELTHMVGEAHGLLWPVAIHVVEAEALEAALTALQEATPLPGRGWKDRIEHCSECPPHLIRKMAALEVAVVTNPSFIYHSGDRYLAQTDPLRLDSLYPMRSLEDAGIPLAAGSDAPVTDPNPMTNIYGAITRRTQSGAKVNGSESVSLERAIAMCTRNVASKGEERFFAGPGRLHDGTGIVLLDRTISEDDSDEILKTKVAMTIIGGRVVYEG